jgi:hypothetical protein
MLIATWILAIATAVLALSGPVALFAWLTARRQDKERRQREREQEARDGVLRDAAERFMTKADASEKFVARADADKAFVPKDWVGAGVFLGLIGAVIAWSTWTERKHG